MRIWYCSVAVFALALAGCSQVRTQDTPSRSGFGEGLLRAQEATTFTSPDADGTFRKVDLQAIGSTLEEEPVSADPFADTTERYPIADELRSERRRFLERRERNEGEPTE